MATLENIFGLPKTNPIGPELTEKWSVSVKTDSIVKAFGDVLIVTDQNAIRCFDINSGELLWTHKERYVSSFLYYNGKLLYSDSKDLLHIFDPSKSSSTAVLNFTDLLIPKGFYKNCLIEKQVFDIVNLKPLDGLPVIPWEGNINKFLIGVNDEGLLFSFDIDNFEKIDTNVKAKGHLFCIGTSVKGSSIILEKYESEIRAYSFPSFKQIWNFKDSEIEGPILFSNKYFGFSNLENTTYVLLSVETGEICFKEEVHRKPFLTGNKLLWSSSKERDFFICHDVTSGKVVNKIAKTFSEVIVEAVDNYLIIKGANSKKITCYEG